MEDKPDQLLMNMQKEMQEQMKNIVSATLSEERKRLEESIMELFRVNIESLWAFFQEEKSKHEKLEHDRTTNLISNFINKDLPAALDEILEKEIAAFRPAVAHAIAPALDKIISSAITESFQKWEVEKAVNQLEKSVSSKLEATVAREIQSQFLTSGRQAIQDALISSFEASVIHTFEKSCKALFDQVDATVQKGLIEHINSAQQQFDSLAISLREAFNSASTITRTLSGQLAEGQRKLLAIATGGPNSKAEVPLDPMKELSRLISEQKYEEALAVALGRSDVSIVSWLCSQVDLPQILGTFPLPLSQINLVRLLEQLSHDIGQETSTKLEWMTLIASSIDPMDPMIATVHVGHILDQVYETVRNLSTTAGLEASKIRILMHVMNFVLQLRPTGSTE